MRLAAAVIVAVCAHPAIAQEFRCEGRGEPLPDFVWRYTFEVDENSARGVVKGTTYGGSPFQRDIQVVFAPDRIHIRAADGDGFIERRTLAFQWGGASGTCTRIAKASDPAPADLKPRPLSQ